MSMLGIVSSVLKCLLTNRSNTMKSCSRCLVIILTIACSFADQTEPLVFHDHRYFLRQIFIKYGDKGIITFEGFEHLLESLGLGRLSFDKDHSVSIHRINGSFQDVHDALNLHDHRHGPKEIADFYLNSINVSSQEAAHFSEADEVFEKTGDFAASSTIVKRNAGVNDPPKRAQEAPAEEGDDGLCLSPRALLHTFGLRPNHSVAITPSRFIHLCPAIVHQLDRKACSVTAAPAEAPGLPVRRGSASQGEAWLHAALAIAVISSVGLLAVLMVKLTRRRSFLHFLVSLAVGTLAGDALLHLLPHALLSEDTDHEGGALICTATFMAIVFFYAIQSLLMLIRSSREKKLPTDGTEASLELRSTCEPPKDEEVAHGHSHGLSNGSSSSLAFLVLVGDGLHNVTDGLAIGASFASDPVAGLATTIAVFCHELPHELGDFAVLINSGMSVKRALLFNLMNSGLSFVGAGVGVWLGEFGHVTHWIYAVTAGTFLYIALGNLVPEMMSYVKTDGKIHGIIIQLSGIVSGGMLMLFIALNEEKLQYLLTR